MSAGTMRAGSVYVAVSAAIGEFTKDMGKVLKTVEQTAAKVKAAAAPLADVGKLFAAGMAGAVYASAKSNAALAADVERLKAQVYTLVADIGDAVAPFVKRLTAAVSSLVGAFQRLSPAAKESAAKFVVFMAATGAGAGAIGKTATLVEGLAKVSSTVLVPALDGAGKAVKALGAALTTAISWGAISKKFEELGSTALKAFGKMALGLGSVLLTLALVAAAVAALVLLAGAVYQAWNSSSSGMKEAVLGAWESIKGLGAKLAEVFAGWWSSFKGFILDSLRTLFDLALSAVKKLSALLQPLASGLGLTKVSAVLADLQSVTGDTLVAKLQEGATFLADKAASAARTLANGAVAVGKDVAEGVSYGLSQSLKGVKRIAADTGLAQLPDKLKAALGGLLGGPGGNTRSIPQGQKLDREPSLVGSSALPEALKAFAQGTDTITQANRERLQALAKSMADAAKEAADRVRDAKASLVAKFAGALGDLGSMVDTFKQGVTAGGPAAAVAAVLGELLTRSAQFQTLVQTLNGIVGMVADAVGAIAEPFIPLLGALSMIIKAGLDALAPAFQAVSALITPMVPSLVVLGELFQGLAPVLALVVQAMVLMMNPLQLLAGPVMRAFFDVLKLVSRAILTVVRAIAGVWNGIVGAVQSVLRTLGSLSILGKKPLSFLEGWADGLDSARVSTDSMTAALNNLAGLTYNAAAQQAAQTAEVVRNREQLAKANEELSNVPAAFKAGLRRFQAQDSQASFNPNSAFQVPVATMPSAGATASRPPPGGVGAGPSTVGGAVQIESVVINTTNAADSADALERALDRAAFRLTGSRGRGGRWAVVAEGG